MPPLSRLCQRPKGKIEFISHLAIYQVVSRAPRALVSVSGDKLPAAGETPFTKELLQLSRIFEC
jgi:hypothetical protein